MRERPGLKDYRIRGGRLLLVILLVAVLLRAGAALYFGNTVEDLPGTADQVSYHTLALRVLAGHGFTFGEPWWPATAAGAPTAHWSYLYTAFLVAVYALLGPSALAARLIQAVLVGLLQPYLAYRLGGRLFGERVGLASAALTALYAYFIYYSAMLMTEMFYITAILAALYLAVCLVDQDYRISTQGRRLKLAAGLGLVLGAAVLLRQLFLLFIPFLFLWALLLRGRRLIFPLAVSGAILVGMILPITAFNYIRFHRFVLLNTNAGYAFFWGNHPIYGTHFLPILPRSLGTYQDLIPAELRGLDEAALDQALLKRGIQFVVDDPIRYARLSLSRVPAYFMFWPSGDSGLISNIARVSSFGLLWPFMLFGLLLAVFNSSRAVKGFSASLVLPLYLFLVIYTGVHLLTWALIRYRLPVDAVLVLFAGVAVVDLAERVPVLRRWMRLSTQ